MKKEGFVIILVFMICSLFADGVAGFQEYFIPGPEDQLNAIFTYVEAAESNFQTVVSVTATTDNTKIIYDHWENGYSPSGDETRYLDAGEYYAFEDNEIGIPLSGTNYDGRDRIYVVGGPIFVARGSFPDPIFSACWEVFPVDAWETDFTVPFGVDLYADNSTVFHDFKKVAVMIMSASAGNSVTINCPDNINDATISLGRGESYYFTGAISGTTINATPDKPIQVQMIVGEETSGGREIRGYSGVPQSNWSNNYWAPVSVSRNSDMFLYNPNASSITINYEDGYGGYSSGTFQIESGETISYQDKTTHFVTDGAHVYTSSSSNEFWGVVSVDTRTSTYDWGFDLIPFEYIRDDYRIGWAPGSGDSNPQEIYNCVFAMSLENDTDIFIDFDGNGTIDQSFNGSSTLDRMDVVKIADTGDHNTSGAHIYTNDKKIALSYGAISGDNSFEGGTTPSGSPALDLGYTILPMPEEWVKPVIKISASDDQEDDVPVVAVGENVKFTMILDTYSYGLDSVDLSADLDVCWEYLAGSTIISHDSDEWSSTQNPVITGSADPGYYLTWDLDRDMGMNDQIVLIFEAHPTGCSYEGENEIKTETTGTYDSNNFTATDNEFVTIDGPDGEFGAEQQVPVFMGHFQILLSGDNPVISWSTHSENSSMGWNIYRNSEDNILEAEIINDDMIDGAGNSSMTIDYFYIDEDELSMGETYWYYLENIEYNGATSMTGSGFITIAEETPVYENGIQGNYPNPFNPKTTINFALKEQSDMKLTIYNLRGQLVKNLIDENRVEGFYSSEWNGTNESGNPVSSGVYFGILEVDGNIMSKKLVLIK